MPVHGLVFTLADDDELRSRALAVLQEDGQLELGPGAGARVAAVAVTDGPGGDGEALARWAAIPGVAHVSFVFSDFSDVFDAGPGGCKDEASEIAPFPAR